MKKNDISKISSEEISNLVGELKKKLVQLKLGKARSEFKDTSVYSKARQSIARYLTELNSRKG